MRRRPFRSLLAGPPLERDRILYTNIWFRGHNNARYAELLPRLARVDSYLITCSARRLVRGIQYRSLVATRRARDRLLFRAANRRYRYLLTSELGQVEHFRGRIVVDVDDPAFSRREVALLNRPNVAAYVVTAEWAAERFRGLGVEKPHHVVPQGVSLASLSEEGVAAASRLRRDGDFVVGYAAAWLLTRGDAGGESPLYNIDHLLELWEAISERLPSARLWLVGGASRRVRQKLANHHDVVLLGQLPRDEALAHVANFDVALYPRTRDQGVQAVKVAEYLGLGIPTVSYDYRVTQILRETGGGLVVSTPGEFADAVELLFRDGAARSSVAGAARAAGRELDWDVLAARYEAEILERHLRE